MIVVTTDEATMNMMQLKYVPVLCGGREEQRRRVSGTLFMRRS